MKIAVTGANGFIGRHVVAAALQAGHRVLAVCRSPQAAAGLQWPSEVEIVTAEIEKPDDAVLARIASADVCIHLAWGALDNFKSMSHVETELPAQYAFLRALLTAGLRKLVVAGTCLEYGMKFGPLHEDTPADPVTPYGLAKDGLHRQLARLQQAEGGFTLVWARLFYLHGELTGRRTLLMQLKEAVARGDRAFPMSQGEQLRDYLSVDEVARRLVALAASPAAQGTYNVCSGSPVSVRRLVEQWIAENGWNISPDLGRYPYPDYEPLAFWGDSRRIDAIMRVQ